MAEKKEACSGKATNATKWNAGNRIAALMVLGRESHKYTGIFLSTSSPRSAALSGDFLKPVSEAVLPIGGEVNGRHWRPLHAGSQWSVYGSMRARQDEESQIVCADDCQTGQVRTVPYGNLQ